MISQGTLSKNKQGNISLSILLIRIQNINRIAFLIVNFDLKDTLSLEHKHGEVKPVLNITLSRLTFFELGGS